MNTNTPITYDEIVARRVARLYGPHTRGVAERAAADPRAREVVDEASGLTVAEISFVLEEEFAGTLTDILARRTVTGIGPTLPDDMVDRVAQAAALLEGWSDERTTESSGRSATACSGSGYRIAPERPCGLADGGAARPFAR